MKQFFETYKDNPKLSALLRENTWTNNLPIFSRCSSIEEKESYLRSCAKALSRNLSPAMVAEYQTLLPDKKILQSRFHKMFELKNFSKEE